MCVDITCKATHAWLCVYLYTYVYIRMSIHIYLYTCILMRVYKHYAHMSVPRLGNRSCVSSATLPIALPIALPMALPIALPMTWSGSPPCAYVTACIRRQQTHAFTEVDSRPHMDSQVLLSADRLACVVG